MMSFQSTNPIATKPQMDQSTLKYYTDNAVQVAERYESVVSNLSSHFADSFIKGGKILDTGCGSGRDLAVLHKLGFDCYGVDPTPEFVAIAQRTHPELVGRIELGELPDLQTPFDGDFDGVLCSAVLMHIDIEQLPATTAAIKSCLKQGGRLLYSVPSKRLDVVASNRDANGRLFIPDQAVRLNSLFSSLGFMEIASWTNSDSMGRDAVEWLSVLLELQTA
jgi:2-polyprenyl-3-methyl-5-hydroxy-6-metoxy-1,4-benzoquinol methylase